MFIEPLRLGGIKTGLTEVWGTLPQGASPLVNTCKGQRQPVGECLKLDHIGCKIAVMNTQALEGIQQPWLFPV